jgi:iron complex transport system substrate-binding protein
MVSCGCASVSRRDFLRLSALLGLQFTLAQGSAAAARPPSGQRIVVLDWMLTESLLLLGITPVAVANPDGFRQTFPAVTLPAAVADVGLIYQPNLELLTLLRPDLIIITPAHAVIAPLLQRIAPTLTVGEADSYGRYSFDQACAALKTLGHFFNQPAIAQAVIFRAQHLFATARARLAMLPGAAQRKVFIVQFIDEAFVRLAGAGSLYGDLLARLGVTNACHAPTSVSGFATTGYDALYAEPEALLIAFSPLPITVRLMLQHNPVWLALPFRQPGHHLFIPPAPANGGVVSAIAFTDALACAITSAASNPAGPPCSWVNS